ncbi:MAG: glycyl-radical enzyme activating protein [Chloroflexota bacterium]
MVQQNSLQPDSIFSEFNPDTLSGVIFDIRKYSIHDGPGIRTAVFLKGCPLSCWWCHNPEGRSPEIEIIQRDNRCIRCGACLSVCEDGATYQQNDQILLDRAKCTLCGACVDECYAEARQLIGKRMNLAQVMTEIETDLPFYEQSNGGVTFSGGEPLMQPRFLKALLSACRQQGIHTALDTCGYASWNLIDSLRQDVNLFLYDIKVLDDTLHRKFTGVSNHLILDNLRRLSQCGSNIIVRFPLIPGVNDNEEQVRQLAELVNSLSNVSEIDILPYHSSAINKYNSLGLDYSLEGLASPQDEQLQSIARMLEEAGLNVKIGG